MRRDQLIEALAAMDMAALADLVLVHQAPLDEMQACLAQVQRDATEVAQTWLAWAAAARIRAGDTDRVESLIRQTPLIPYAPGGAL